MNNNTVPSENTSTRKASQPGPKRLGHMVAVAKGILTFMKQHPEATEVSAVVAWALATGVDPLKVDAGMRKTVGDSAGGHGLHLPCVQGATKARLASEKVIALNAEVKDSMGRFLKNHPEGTMTANVGAVAS